MIKVEITDKNKDAFISHLIEVFLRHRSHELYVPSIDEQKRIFDIAITTFNH